MAKTKTKSKVAKIINVISVVLLALCAGVLIYTTVSYSSSGLVRFFNYSFHVIQTHSMEPEIKVGDLVVVKQVPYSEIKIDDDILFKCEDASLPIYGKYVVHRVIEIVDVEKGLYKTKGINNPDYDKVLSKAEGKAVSVSSSWGAVFSFLTSWKNILFIVAIAGVLIFSIFEICSVVSNASKLKAEKDRKKLQSDEQLKEKLKNELLDEIQKEKLNSEQVEKEANLPEEENQEENNNEQNDIEHNDKNIIKDDGSDKK